MLVLKSTEPPCVLQKDTVSKENFAATNYSILKKNTTLSFGCNPRANFKYLRVTMLIGGWFPRFISCRHAGVSVESIPGKVHQGQRVWVERKQKNIFLSFGLENSGW